MLRLDGKSAHGRGRATPSASGARGAAKGGHGAGSDPLEDSGASGTRRTEGARTGGRSARVLRAVLDATISELARGGYAALRLETVAAIAGVNKTTVYRRWPTKADLAGAALRDLGSMIEKVPDTGELRTDLVELVSILLRFLRTETGQALMRVIVTERSEPDIDRLAREMRDEKQKQRLVVIERAKARGELPPDAPGTLILDAVFAPIMTRALRFKERVDTATIRSLVDLVVTGAQHGGGRT